MSIEIPRPDVKALSADIQRIAARRLIDIQRESFLGTLSARAEAVTGSMVVDIEAKILSLEHEDFEEITVAATVSVRVPSSWWEMFKRDCMPAWFTKRFPVKMVTISKTEKTTRSVAVRIQKICPHVKVDTDKLHLNWLSFPQPTYFKEGRR